ncbi:MAG: hypothetical protein PHY23_05145 [Oscillospiraceae bacterium]|nr:hypothetical protein [Oscillospiraceae bacterium]
MQFFELVQTWIGQLGETIFGLLQTAVPYTETITWVIRWVMPGLACLILFHAARPLLIWKKEPEI